MRPPSNTRLALRLSGRDSCMAPTEGGFGMRSLLGASAIIAAVLASSCASAGRRPDPAAFERNRERSLDRVASRGDRVEIAGHAADATRAIGVQAWLLAVPRGELKLELRSVELRNEGTGERVVVVQESELAELEQAGVARGPLELAPLGNMRGVRMAAMRLDPERGFAWRGVRWRVRSFDAAVAFPEFRGGATLDSAISDRRSSIRRMLELSLANPDGIDRYAQPATERTDAAPPPAWQPRPELSPGIGWLKLPVSKDGLYGIDARWLEDHGLDPAALRPQDMQVVSRGREVVGIPAGIEGATFSGGARLAFPALASDSAETAERIYYIGRRAESSSTEHAFGPRHDGARRLASFVRRRRVEQDNHLQTRVGNFLSIREMAWVWERMTSGTPHKFTFDLADLPTPAPAARAKVLFYIAGSGSIGAASVDVTINGTVVASRISLMGSNAQIACTVPPGVLRRQGNEIAIGWHEQNPGAPVWLDAIELECESLFRADGSECTVDFAAMQGIEGPALVEAVGFRPYRVVAVDVTDPDTPVRLPVDVEGDVAVVHATLSPATRIRIVEGDSVPRAPAAQPSVWMDWTSESPLKNVGLTDRSFADFSADGVIIHHARFAEQAQAIAEQWRADGRETLVVDVASIYEAWSHGEVSGQAIRSFLQRAVHDWTGRRPTHALFIGDCTSDGRGVSRSGVENLVPTHVARGTQSAAIDEYASDAWFSWLAGEDEVADIIVGRISVNSTDDANAVAAKIATYRSAPADEWSSRVVCLSDPGNFADRTRAMVQSASGDDAIVAHLSSAEFPWEDNFYLPEKLLSNDDAKVSPAFAQRIESEFQSGAGIITWMGHGSPNLWSNQRVWFGGGTDNSDSLRLDNVERLPFVATFTCNNGAIDYPMPRWNVTIAEDMVRLANGGAIACFVPSGPGFPVRHVRIGEGLLEAATRHGVRELGMLAEMARLNMQATLGPDDHSRMYLLLGDPTLQIPAPSWTPDLRTSGDGTFADTRDVQPLSVALVAGPTAITEGSVEILDATGAILGTAPLFLGRDLWQAQVSMLPPAADRVHVVARGRTPDGAYWQSGTWLDRATPDLAIVHVEHRGAESLFRIENRGARAAEAKLVVRQSSAGDAEQETALPISVPDGASVVVAVPLAGDVVAVQAEVEPSRRANRRAGLPSSRWSDLVVARTGPDAVDLQVNARVIHWASAQGAPRWMASVANAGTESASAAVEWRIETADGVVESGRSAVGAIAPGKTVSATIAPTAAFDPVAGATLHVRCIAEGAADGDPANDEASWTCDPGGLPDIAIDPASIRVSPPHLVEGATVFVDATVTNAGMVESAACIAGLFAEDDAEMRTPLTSMADRVDIEIPPLAPGESRPIRLRWDPMANLGTRSVVLALDTRRALLESDRANNRVAVPLDIKSKWRLEPRGITFAPHDASSVRLVARVANVGQTDARRVAVFFYADEEQIPANLVGEKVVDVVPAESEIDVDWLWDARGWDLQKARRPSYAIAIKGSLQRTSSVVP